MAKFLDTKGAINYLHEAHGVVRTEPTLRRYRVQGLGPTFHKMGNNVSYSTTDLDAWVSSQRTAHASTASYDAKWRRPKAPKKDRQMREMFGTATTAAE